MEILAICGSLRRPSINRVVMESLPELAPTNVTITFAPSFADIPFYDGNDERSIPALEALDEAISNADGVIIVTPEYNFSVPAGLKNAFDWLSRRNPQPFKDKPVAIQSVSMSPLGGARVQYHLRQILVCLEARVLNKPEIFVGTAGAKLDFPNRKLVDAMTRDLIQKQLGAFAGFIRG